MELFKTPAFFTLAKASPVTAVAIALVAMLMLAITLAATCITQFTFLEFAVFAMALSMNAFGALFVVAKYTHKAT